jgi:hypothetical protein
MNDKGNSNPSGNSAYNGGPAELLVTGRRLNEDSHWWYMP